MSRLVKLLVSIGYFLAQYAANVLLFIFTPDKRRTTCVVLCYHGVLDADRFKFARQMDMLRRWSLPICIEKPEFPTKGAAYAAVTFDDGLMSFKHNALPELIMRQIPATIFIPTGYLGKKCTWMRSAEVYMREEGKQIPSKDLIQLEYDMVMDVDNLKLLDKKLLVIGSHGVTHNNLEVMSDEAANKELTESKATLEKIVGRPVRLFSFPRGKFNKKLLELCKATGYSRTFSITPCQAFASSDEYVTGRVVVEPTDWSIEFWLKIKGAYCWLPAMRSLKNLISRYTCNKFELMKKDT
jgi:peptidoglycan/xylan/chitin deacetylase (PgdA/CDA1 family)